MVYKVPCERSFEYKLIKGYIPPMCTAGMNHFRINKPMHKSFIITETNWVSWDVYLSCSTISAWLSQAENHKDHLLKSSNHKNHRLKTAKLFAKGKLSKSWRTSAGPVPFLQSLVWLYFVGCWFFHSFVLGEIGGEKDWRREVAKFGGKIFCRSLQIWTHMWLGVPAIWNSVTPAISSVVIEQLRGQSIRWGYTYSGEKKAQKQSLKDQPGADRI